WLDPLETELRHAGLVWRIQSRPEAWEWAYT
ncbi:uncharacterized protein METZ01_LOCUS517487, partial [marine metagenome]